MKKLLAASLSALAVAATLASCGGEEKDIIKQRTEAMENVESACMTMTGVVDVSVMGQKAAFDINADIDYDIASMLYYLDMEMDMGEFGESQSVQMYMDMNEENPASYANVGGEWVKQELELDPEMLATSMTTTINMDKYMKDVETAEEDFNGKGCYKLTYDVELDIEGILEDAGMSLDDLMAQSAAQSGEEVDEATMALVKELVSNLGKVQCVEYINKDTKLVEHMEIDMTQFVKDMIDKVFDALAENGMAEASAYKSLIQINSVKFDATFNSYNDVVVELPAEVLAA